MIHKIQVNNREKHIKELLGTFQYRELQGNAEINVKYIAHNCKIYTI